MISVILQDVQRIHLIGIGGIGVSAVARGLLAMGYDVSGSDVRESQLTIAIRNEGARVTIGHDASLIEDKDLVVYSTAIPDTNPELIAARASDVRVVHRAEVLGAMLAGWESLGVIGTHGKGTVSAMITSILEAAQKKPSFIIGGLLNEYGTNTRFHAHAEARYLVVEIDESDGSLVHVQPNTLVVNNLEADHLNYYGDLETIRKTVVGVLETDADRHMAVLHVGDEGVRALLPRLSQDITMTSCGFDTDLDGYPADTIGTDLRVGPTGSQFRIIHQGMDLGDYHVPQPGRYNAMNALVAASACLSANINPEAIRQGLQGYKGIENRFTVVDAGGVRVVKDYISHPTGMRRVLAAAKTLADGPITAVFKPYRFTMIHYLGDEYSVAFKDADETIITELYTAGEVPIPGIDTEWLVGKIRQAGSEVVYIQDMNAIVDHLMERITPGLQIIFFGGDDLFEMADDLIEKLNQR